jgi:hypothetical protein
MSQVVPESANSLRRMVQFAQTFPQPEIVATLSQQSSVIHFDHGRVLLQRCTQARP